MTTVTFCSEEVEFINQAGDDRAAANADNNDIPDYDHRRFNLTTQQCNRLGVMAEAAAFKWLGGDILNHSLTDWAHYVPNDHEDYYRLVKEQHDLFNTYEVRRANYPNTPLPVRAKDRADGVVLLHVWVPYTQVERYGPIKVSHEAELLGWAYATDPVKPTTWARQAGSGKVFRKPMHDFPKEVLA